MPARRRLERSAASMPCFSPTTKEGNSEAFLAPPYPGSTRFVRPAGRRSCTARPSSFPAWRSATCSP
eukprot:8464993-Alexandrium_andersonii.AAC.1